MKFKTLTTVVWATLFAATTARATPTITTLASFNYTNGQNPNYDLTIDSAGNLYGTAGTTVFEIPAGTNTISPLAVFQNTANNNGWGLVGSPFIDAAGNCYAVAQQGGPNSDGTIVELAAGTHAVSTLATFNGTNGSFPASGLISDSSGNLYGTTFSGGTSDDGTIFEISAATKTLSTLANFNSTNGAQPVGSLYVDSAGNLYGTTKSGGTNGLGTVFELAAGTNTLSTLATFNGTNGQTPSQGLTSDSAGNLYGTTNGPNFGTIFKISAITHTFSTITSFSFIGPQNGLQGSMLVDANGDLFGTLPNLGPNHSQYANGLVFDIPAGTDTMNILTSFSSQIGAGGEPLAGLIADSAGNLYGTTEGGGASDVGTVFEITNSGFVVPEPTSLSLLAIAGLTLLHRRRRSV